MLTSERLSRPRPEREKVRRHNSTVEPIHQCPVHNHLIQEHVLLLSKETLLGPFHLIPCQWTRLISGYSAAASAVSHQLAIAIAIASGKTTVAACLPMVCTCSPIRTVAIAISSISPCTFHECHRRRRIVPLWRLYRQIQALSNDLYVFSTRDFSTSLLQTSGDVPSPRHGHRAVLTSTTLLIWGGRTGLSNQNVQSQTNDDSFYLLNLCTSDLIDVKTCSS